MLSIRERFIEKLLVLWEIEYIEQKDLLSISSRDRNICDRITDKKVILKIVNNTRNIIIRYNKLNRITDNIIAIYRQEKKKKLFY